MVFLNIFVNSENNSVIFDFIKGPNKVIKDLKKKNDNNLFIFGHIILPHPPWIFDKNCNEVINDNSGMVDSNLETPEVYFKGYKNNYVCTLEIINNLITSINAHDPDAIVIIQSDHSISHDSFPEISLKPIFSRYDMFNLIKVNNDCKKYLSNSIDQVNGVRLALSCASNQEVKLLEKKSYFADFKIGNASIGGTFIVKEIMTFEEELSVREKY